MVIELTKTKTEECHTQPAIEVERLEETRDETAEKIEELDQRFGKVDDEEEKVQLISLKTRDNKTSNLIHTIAETFCDGTKTIPDMTFVHT